MTRRKMIPLMVPVLKEKAVLFKMESLLLETVIDRNVLTRELISSLFKDYTPCCYHKFYDIQFFVFPMVLEIHWWKLFLCFCHLVWLLCYQWVWSIFSYLLSHLHWDLHTLMNLHIPNIFVTSQCSNYCVYLQYMLLAIFFIMREAPPIPLLKSLTWFCCFIVMIYHYVVLQKFYGYMTALKSSSMLKDCK